MAATLYALGGEEGGRFQGTSWATAFGLQSNSLDILQIVDDSDISVGAPVVRVNVDSNGVVHNPASNPTNGTNAGVYLTRLGSGQSTAAYFADAFNNPSNLDIIQLISPTGGSILNWIDFQGVSH